MNNCIYIKNVKYNINHVQKILETLTYVYEMPLIPNFLIDILKKNSFDIFQRSVIR